MILYINKNLMIIEKRIIKNLAIFRISRFNWIIISRFPCQVIPFFLEKLIK